MWFHILFNIYIYFKLSLEYMYGLGTTYFNEKRKYVFTSEKNTFSKHSIS